VQPLQRTLGLVVRVPLVVAGGGSDGYYLQAVVEWVGVASQADSVAAGFVEVGMVELVEGVVEGPTQLRREVYQETMWLVPGPEEVPNGAEKMSA